MMKRFAVILFFCLLSAYIIFFPRNLSKELIVIPSWSVDIKTSESAPSGIPSVPFRLAGRVGYLAKNGEISYYEDILDRADLSDRLMVNYTSASSSRVLRAPDGSAAGSLSTDNLPFFINGRLFMISPDRMTLSEYSGDGSILWKNSPGAVITSADANTGMTALGLLDGTLVVLDETGSEIYSYFSTDSRYSAVYSCAVSRDGRRLAAVTGLYPQLLYGFEADSDGFVPVFSSKNPQQYRRSIFLRYSDDGRLLYVESPDGLRVIDNMSLQEKHLQIPGEISAAALPGPEELSFLVFSDEDYNRIRILDSGTVSIADFLMPAGEVFFSSQENCFYLGTGSVIVRYDLIEG